MHIQGYDERVRMFMRQPVYVDVSYHKAGRATICVLIYPLQVLLYAYIGSPNTM